jgi:hypothetical protein
LPAPLAEEWQLRHGDIVIGEDDIHPESRREMLRRAFDTLIGNGISATISKRVQAAATANGSASADDWRAQHPEEIESWTRAARADVLRRFRDGHARSVSHHPEGR